MTTTQRQRRVIGLTANPAQGVRIDRVGDLRRTAAGRLALPLSVSNNGSPICDGDLVMTNDEATALHAHLGRLLAESIPPTATERSLTS
ncbi:hypothetical protein [Streptomyces sp. NBC_01373]|uniref:hypothetical protein n=1 Tax=Streptomyces sp. NBC_01373 TaxID=2903843 RepID=UPI0022550C1D|nr:hypothetical protein [Streptomyces sp. NBC_01373]MCX4705633.1 hypothetical protein [Streptomyces sp. NBC_01373]